MEMVDSRQRKTMEVMEAGHQLTKTVVLEVVRRQEVFVVVPAFVHLKMMMVEETVDMVDSRQRKMMEEKEADHQLTKTVILEAVRHREIKVEVPAFARLKVMMVEETVEMVDSRQRIRREVKEADHHLTKTVVLEAVPSQEVEVEAIPFVHLKAMMVEEDAGQLEIMVRFANRQMTMAVADVVEI